MIFPTFSSSPFRSSNIRSLIKNELDKSNVMAWVDSPAQSQMNLFLEYPFPRVSVVMSLKKKKRQTVTRDVASSDWLKLPALCYFRAQSVSKNKSFCDCAGARSQSDRSTLLVSYILKITLKEMEKNLLRREGANLASLYRAIRNETKSSCYWLAHVFPPLAPGYLHLFEL